MALVRRRGIQTVRKRWSQGRTDTALSRIIPMAAASEYRTAAAFIGRAVSAASNRRRRRRYIALVLIICNNLTAATRDIHCVFAITRTGCRRRYPIASFTHRRRRLWHCNVSEHKTTIIIE